MEQGATLLILEVQLETPLAPRNVAEPNRNTVCGLFSDFTHRFTDAIGRLDHDHIRTVISHGHGHMRTGQKC